MKLKLFILGIISGIICLNSCNDDMGLVGTSIQPAEDKPFVYVDSFMVEASTVYIDSIYAKTATGLLGELYDPLYGNLKSDFMCQFYVNDEFTFEHTPIGGKIDSIDFYMFYNRGYLGGWIGDSLAPMTATVYPIIEPLERYYYTNANPADYTDLKNPLGAQTYTARNLAVSDSAWTATNTSGTLLYTPYVRVRLPLELGQKFYDESINNPGTFKNQETFNKFFPGVYVTTTFGSGNMLNVFHTEISIYYQYDTINSEGRDTVLSFREPFPVTKEVIQMNHIKNEGLEDLLQPSDEFAYLKTPAGVFTRLTIPAKEIISKIEGREVNDFSFSLKAMPQESWKYAFSPPSYLLLVPEDSIQTFFESGMIENNVTSYASYPYQMNSYSSSSSSYLPYTYTFGNISSLLKYQAANAPDKDLHMIVVPIDRDLSTDYSGYATAPSTAVRHYLKPSGVKLRKDPEVMKMRVVTSVIPDKK